MPHSVALADLQRQFRQNALADIDAAGVEPTAPAMLVAGIVADGLDPERRLAIHRNHYATTLVEALGGIYEVARILVGPDYFDAFARRYARARPPAGPCLFEYGVELPDVLADAPGMTDHGYVADIARLEWAMHESFHAPAADVLPPTRLTATPSDRLADVRLTLHPTVRLIAADFPVDGLWRAARSGDVSPDDLKGPPAWLILARPGFDVAMEAASAGCFRLLAALSGGASLGQAAEAAATADETFDFGEALGNCLRQGVFADELHVD